MKVKLIQATENAGKMIADIASICYGKEEAKNPERLLKNLYKLGHHSVFEHAYYTFKIEGISRACLAQLTRHRHASYTVRSQRYSDESYQGVVIPTDIANNFSMQKKYVELLAETQRFYQYLLDNGYKKEDARFVLPQAMETELYMSCNLRELIHIADLRLSKAAQWEIRELVRGMVRLVVEHSPELEFMFEGVLDNEN
jgi:thymidylate synthase (FAD)